MTGTAAEDVVAKHAGTLRAGARRDLRARALVGLPRVAEPAGVRRGCRGGRQGGVRGPPRPPLRAGPGRHGRLGRRASARRTGRSWGSATRRRTWTCCSPRRRRRSRRGGTPGREVRAAVCVEIVERVNARSFEIANAVMHTSGQAFVMAFQAGGPHAQDRALEAVAYAYAEQARVPATARWEKPQGKRPAAGDGQDVHGRAARGGAGGRLHHVPDLELLPRAVRQPGHRQRRGGEAAPGGDPAAGDHGGDRAGGAGRGRLRPRPGHAGRGGARRPGRLASWRVRPEVRVVDFTGSTAFGEWLEDNARQAVVYTEKAGVNAVVIDSTDDYAGMLANLAFSLSLYSGQMCTTPQDLLVPRGRHRHRRRAASR